jgi:hypothetical protein
MKIRFRWHLLGVCVPLLLNTAAVPPARAQRPTEIEGHYSGISPPVGLGLTSFTWNMGHADVPVVWDVNDLKVDVSSFTNLSDNVQLNMASPMFKLIEDPILMKEADFTLSNPGTLSPNMPADGTGLIFTGVTLVSNNTDQDLSEFSSGGLLSVTFRDMRVDAGGGSGGRGPSTPGTATWPYPPGGTVTVTWRLTAVPEPSSLILALGGLLTLLGVGWFKHFRR